MKICANGVNLYFDVDGLGLVHQGSAMRQRPTVVALHGGPGIEEPVVIGASFGGFVAQAYATRYPEHVGKLVLAGTTARFHAEQAFSMFAKLGGPEAEAVARRFFADCSGDVFQEYLETCMPLYSRVKLPPQQDPGAELIHLDVARAFVGGEWHRFDFRSALGAIACPTLVLAGEEDPVFPIVGAEELAAGIRSDLVRFERFPGIGHNVLSECPRALEMVLELVAG